MGNSGTQAEQLGSNPFNCCDGRRVTVVSEHDGHTVVVARDPELPPFSVPGSMLVRMPPRVVSGNPGLGARYASDAGSLSPRALCGLLSVHICLYCSTRAWASCRV